MTFKPGFALTVRNTCEKRLSVLQYLCLKQKYRIRTRNRGSEIQEMTKKVLW